MEQPQIYQRAGDWMDSSGPLSDVVISSRIRLARNIAGFLFFSRANEQQQSEVLEFVRQKIMASELQKDLWYLNIQDTPPLQRSLLAERHLVSKELAHGRGARGVALTHDESLTLMINEEDHLRIQVLASGLQLHETYQRISRVDDMLEQKVEYAFSPQYGYLTACPTNVGTGIRVSVMLHLPALKITGQIEKFFSSVKDMHLAVRGIHGEGSEPVGDFYQLSNQTTLGKTEERIIDDLISQAIEPVVQYERAARAKLMRQRPAAIDDKIFRSLGILSHARIISSDETRYLLSYIRLGIHLKRIKNVSLKTVNELSILIQPAHLQNLYQRELDPAARDELRAGFIQKRLGLGSR